MNKISVITINYNDYVGLEKTIESVVNQSYKNIEYIVIDGGSTDGSLDIIKKYQQQIFFTVSEQDSGIYNAMNKGIKAATGDYILFLNSGDYLINNKIIEQLNSQVKFDISFAYGNLIYSINAKPTQLWTPPVKLSFSYFLNYSLPHPATLIKRNLFFKYGFYDESLKIISDWKFFIVCICKHDETHQHIDLTVSNFDNSGISSQLDNLQKINFEKEIVLKENFSQFRNDIPLLKELETKRFKQFFYLKNQIITWKLLKGFMNLLMFFGDKNSCQLVDYYKKIN